MPIIELTDEGVVRESFTQIVDRNEQELRDALERPKLDATSARSFFGAMNNAFSSRLDELCQYGQAVHDSRDPDRAPPATLAGLARFRGLTRGGPGAGSAFFQVTTNAAITFDTGTVEVHPLGDDDNVWTNARDTELTTPGVFLVEFVSELTGEDADIPVSESLVIDNGPVSITRIRLADENDITLPTQIETPAALRIRMRNASQSSGTTLAGSIEAAVEAIPGVSRTTVTVPNPGELEIVVTDDGVADGIIAQAIYGQIAAGVVLVGEETGLAAAANGDSYEIRFTRPPRLDTYVWADVNGTFDVGEINAAVQEYYDTLAAGQNVSALEVLCILQNLTDGVTTFRVSAVEADVPARNLIDTRDVPVNAGTLAELGSIVLNG